MPRHTWDWRKLTRHLGPMIRRPLGKFYPKRAQPRSRPCVGTSPRVNLTPFSRGSLSLMDGIFGSPSKSSGGLSNSLQIIPPPISGMG